jgi:hypothetical protein
MVQRVNVHVHVASPLTGVGAAARLVAHRLGYAAAAGAETIGGLRLDLLLVFLLCRAGKIPIKGQI